MIHLLLIIIYLSFISLGLPDSLLGAAWPSMFEGFGVPVSYAGIVSVIVSAGTIVSSLSSDFMTKKIGTGKITAISVATTAVALFGFSTSTAFWQICLWAIPYGLGAGSVDAALNNYVALHYASRHMSWLHCMWGVGTVIGPTIMGQVLVGGGKWNTGYLIISVLQITLSAVLVISLPLWKKKAAMAQVESGEENPQSTKALTLPQIFRIPGAKAVMITFFCYCAAEATAMLWSASYMVLQNGVSPELAASLASLFFIGITVGRLISGFMTIKFSDTQMIRIGQSLLVLGCLCLFLPFGLPVTVVGIVLFGLGCAPIYPSIIHSTPYRFGAEKSQALIGVQMASAYMGSCLMPPLFGLLANHITPALFPVYLIVISLLMVVMHEILVRKTAK